MVDTKKELHLSQDVLGMETEMSLFLLLFETRISGWSVRFAFLPVKDRERRRVSLTLTTKKFIPEHTKNPAHPGGRETDDELNMYSE